MRLHPATFLLGCLCLLALPCPAPAAQAAAKVVEVEGILATVEGDEFARWLPGLPVWLLQVDGEGRPGQIGRASCRERV